MMLDVFHNIVKYHDYPKINMGKMRTGCQHPNGGWYHWAPWQSRADCSTHPVEDLDQLSMTFERVPSLNQSTPSLEMEMWRECSSTKINFWCFFKRCTKKICVFWLEIVFLYLKYGSWLDFLSFSMFFPGPTSNALGFPSSPRASAKPAAPPARPSLSWSSYMSCVFYIHGFQMFLYPWFPLMCVFKKDIVIFIETKPY